MSFELVFLLVLLIAVASAALGGLLISVWEDLLNTRQMSHSSNPVRR